MKKYIFIIFLIFIVGCAKSPKEVSVEVGDVKIPEKKIPFEEEKKTEESFLEEKKPEKIFDEIPQEKPGAEEPIEEEFSETPQTIECVEVVNNGLQQDKLDITFVASGYSTSEGNLFTDDVNRLLREGLFATEPFRSYRNRINVHRLNSLGENFNCISPSTCNYNLALSVAEYNCQDVDQLVILEGGGGIEIRGIHRGGYTPRRGNMNTEGVVAMSRSDITQTGNERSHIVLVHELGHSFGNLEDEYTEEGRREGFGISDTPDFDNLNCDPIGCPRWCSGNLPAINSQGVVNAVAQSAENIKCRSQFSEGYCNCFSRTSQNQCLEGEEATGCFWLYNSQESSGVSEYGGYVANLILSQWGTRCIPSGILSTISMGNQCMEGTGCYAGCGFYDGYYRSTPSGTMAKYSTSRDFGVNNIQTLRNRLEQYR